MTDHIPTTEDSWEPCAAGELQRLAQSVRARQVRAHRKELVSTAAAVLAAVASVVLVTMYVRDRSQPSVPGDMYYAGISCTEVRKSMPEMTAGKLEDARVAQIQDHLRQCQPCREMLEKMRRPMSQAPDHPSVDAHRHAPGPRRSMLAYLEWSPPPR